MSNKDIQVLRRCVKALDGSSSRKMLKANLEFLIDRYFAHPARDLPEHLKEK